MGVRSRSGKSTKPTATKGTKSPSETKTPAPAAPAAKPQSLWQKVAAKDVELTPREALRAAHWIRQMIAVLAGFIFGLIPLTGAPAILTFFLIACTAPPALLSMSNELDSEEIAKTALIQFEGLMPATALFLLTWIVSYTIFLPPRISP